MGEAAVLRILCDNCSNVMCVTSHEVRVLGFAVFPKNFFFVFWIAFLVWGLESLQVAS
jgi:hypothetical protein